MGRTVSDVALLDSVITGKDLSKRVRLNGLRLGVPHGHFWENLDPEIAKVAESALSKLKAASAVLVDLNLESIPGLIEKLGGTIVLYEFGYNFRAYLDAVGGGITYDEVMQQVTSKDVAGVVAFTDTIRKEDYEAAFRVLRPQLQKFYADRFRQHNVAAVVFPTAPLPGRPINEAGDTGQDTVELNGQQVPTFATYIRNTVPGSLAGIPGLSVPVGFTESQLSVGLEFDCPVNSDPTLLGLGMSVEEEPGMLPVPRLA